MPRIPFAKGNPGRPKGSKNKVSQSIKEQHLEALDRVGGVEYLRKLALKKPAVFMSGIHRMIPDEQKHDVGGEIVFRHPDLIQRSPERTVKVIQASEAKALEHRG